MSSINTSAPGFDLQMKVSELSESILSKNPRMPTLLHEIWKTLKQYPENVTLLSEEDIAIIVRGLENQTNTFLAQSVVSKSKGSSKSLVGKIASLGDDAF